MRPPGWRRRTMPVQSLACLLAFLTTGIAGGEAAVEAASRVPAKPDAARKAEPGRGEPLAPKLYLTWNAPFGASRATTRIAAPCGDSTVTDTLYLTFDPGKNAPGFFGATAVLHFDPPAGSELPDRWKHGSASNSPVRVVFTSDPDRGFVTPWSPQGAGAPYYDVVAGRGRLRLVYAIAENSGPGVEAGRLYGIARVLVARSPAGADDCATPLCIEWSEGSLAFGLHDEQPVDQGELRVSLNAPDGACLPRHGAFGAVPWKPKGIR
jgi:hypothetical protein